MGAARLRSHNSDSAFESFGAHLEGSVMAFRKSLLPAVNRFAAGIDVGPFAVRLVVISHRLRASGPLRIEAMAMQPLPPGAMAGIEIVNRLVVTRALREVFARVAAPVATRVVRCAMAMPGSATLTSTLPLAQLEEAARPALVASGYPLRHDPTLGALEPAVMLEAERIAGIERHALAVDWVLDGSPRVSGYVTIAATGRDHLEARIECAAAAGITLTAVDSEPYAALRALRHAAHLELGPHAPYAALWVGSDGIYGWRMIDDEVAADVRYPAPEYSDLFDALRDLARDAAFDCVLVGGDLALLEGIGLTLADVGDMLGCATLLWDCESVGEPMARPDDPLLLDPTFAAAFGLALRGVIE
jgi:Tfp pilus assembly PilM family ATPase